MAKLQLSSGFIWKEKKFHGSFRSQFIWEQSAFSQLSAQKSHLPSLSPHFRRAQQLCFKMHYKIKINGEMTVQPRKGEKDYGG